MEIGQIRSFVAVADRASFTRAADDRHLTQSAISQQIRSLEDGLDVRLFERSAHAVRLTPIGERFLPRARQILSALAAAERTVEEAGQALSGTLKIGCPDALACHFLPGILASFARAHPGVSILLVNKPSRDLERRVDAGELDIAFFSREADPEPLWRYAMVAVARADVFSTDTIALEDLRDQWLLLLERGTRHRAVVDRALRRARVSAAKVLELGDVSIQLAMAREGLGVAIVPDFAFEPVDGLVRSSVDGLPDLVVVERRGAHGNRRAAQAFADLARGIKRLAL